jgi:uncharacterized protein (TIGR01777 family)
MATVLITGGTGLIGTALTKALLEKNYKVIILSRSKESSKPGSLHGNVSYAHWDVEKQIIDKAALAKADYIVHLAGAGIADKRWTKNRKREIKESRVKGGELIVKALQESPNKIKAVIGASAIGWYGADPQIPNPHPFREDDEADKGFLGETCFAWEQSIQPLVATAVRVVKLRTGIVLSHEGGALKEFKRPLQFGVAAILGSGRQMISWIHIEDLVRIYIMAIENEEMRGIYNAVAPSPVSNKKFTLQLARIRKGNFFVPIYVPSFILKLVLGEMSIEVLKSATVSCEKIHYNGFTFMYPSIEVALKCL